MSSTDDVEWRLAAPESNTALISLDIKILLNKCPENGASSHNAS
jgi:hypothetical protein